MATGKVKWFDDAKGYGFIEPDAGGKDVFVHVSALETAGIVTLKEGQPITYELQDNKGRTCAGQLKI